MITATIILMKIHTAAAADATIILTIITILSLIHILFGVEPPLFVTLRVVDTEPGVRGDTATNVTKPATLETGAVIKVPIFINNDELIRIDTRTGEYMERA